VLNVGASAGSYEPADRQVTPVEPSAPTVPACPRARVRRRRSLTVGEAARNLAVLARKAGWHQQASSIALSVAASPLLAGTGTRLAAERGPLIQSAAYTAARAGDRDGIRELTDEVASTVAQCGRRPGQDEPDQHIGLERQQLIRPGRNARLTQVSYDGQAQALASRAFEETGRGS
jgi:hypothetical protein